MPLPPLRPGTPPSVSMNSFLRPKSIGELAEEQRTEARTGDVDGGGDADLAGGQLDAASRFGQSLGDIADHRDFEAVEYPDATESDDHPPVKPRPRQPVQPARNLRRDRVRSAAPHSCAASSSSGREYPPSDDSPLTGGRSARDPPRPPRPRRSRPPVRPARRRFSRPGTSISVESENSAASRRPSAGVNARSR